MLFGFIGLIIAICGLCFEHTNTMLLGFGFLLFDLSLEVINLKSQLWEIGVALRDELKEIKEKMKDG